MHDLDPKKYKSLADHPRIYPGYWAPILVSPDAEHIIGQPMRYRLRPANSSNEVPAKYNMFNARKDGLKSRQIWRTLYGSKHGLVSLRSFYEWVSDEKSGKKKVVEFTGTQSELQYVPVLFDEWQGPAENDYIASFAIVTTEPNPEVLAAGHDRSPIVLDVKEALAWLHTKDLSIDDFNDILDHPRKEYFKVADATP